MVQYVIYQASSQLTYANLLLFGGTTTKEMCETISVSGDTSDDEDAANSLIIVDSINAVDKTMIMLYITMFCIILCAIVDVEYKYTLGSLDNVAGAPSQIRIPTDLES